MAAAGRPWPAAEHIVNAGVREHNLATILGVAKLT
jgi:hypothetical protein